MAEHQHSSDHVLAFHDPGQKITALDSPVSSGDLALPTVNYR